MTLVALPRRSSDNSGAPSSFACRHAIPIEPYRVGEGQSLTSSQIATLSSTLDSAFEQAASALDPFSQTFLEAGVLATRFNVFGNRGTNHI